MKNQFKILCGAVALAMAGQVSAATNWTLNTGSVVGNNSTVTATSTGWANTVSNTATNLEIQSAPNYLRLYAGVNGDSAGLGINNLDGCGTSSTSNCVGDAGDVANAAPEHAMDNQGRYEMVLLTFSQSVKLTNVKFGWIGTDSDYTVMAYTGAENPNTTLAGNTSTWASVAANSGWKSIGNYSDAVLNANSAINDNPDPSKVVYSSYWLIGAYNPVANPTGGNVTGTGSDYLKLYSVTGCVTGTTGCKPPGQVPEPGSLALFGLALLGMLTLRKRQQA